MVCVTVRDGRDCPFMTKKGCSFNGGICHEIVEKCGECNRKIEFSSRWYCTAYPDPSQKWKHGNCNLATHTGKGAASGNKVKINPLKASKRAAR